MGIESINNSTYGFSRCKTRAGLVVSHTLIPVSNVGAPVWVLAVAPHIQFNDTTFRKAQKVVHILESLLPLFETQMEFLAQDFRLAQPQLMWLLRDWISRLKILSLSLSSPPHFFLSLSPFLSFLSLSLSIWIALNQSLHRDSYKKNKGKLQTQFLLAL